MDLERVYNIKEHTLANILMKVYVLPPHSEDGKRLKAWKVQDKGFFELLEAIALARQPSSIRKTSFTLYDVTVFLDTLMRSKGVEERLALFRPLITKVPAKDLIWLMRILIKKMNHGIPFKTFCNTLHEGSHIFYEHQASLSRLCDYILRARGGEEEAFSFSLESFVPFNPMLCGRRDISRAKDLGNVFEGPYWVETKYDGERALIHIQRRRMRVFSRYLQDATSIYNTLLIHIKRALDKNVDNVILDGEIVVWNEETERVEPFGKHKEVARLHEESQDRSRGYAKRGCKFLSSSSMVNRHFFFQVFDVVRYNDQDLIRQPLSERKKLLETILKDVPTRVERVRGVKVKDPQEVLTLFHQQVSAKEEGIVVKNLRSPYLLGQRQAKAWLKLKPGYTHKIKKDMDVVIVGANYGGSQLHRVLYSYTVAVRDEEADVFYPIGRIATGLSTEDRQHLLRDLEYDWVKEKPTNVDYGTGYDQPAFWIDPTKSIVLQVQAMEIVECEKRICGVTLRCPRIEKIRYDKDPEFVLTLKELRDSIRTKDLQQLRTKIKTHKPKKVYTPLTVPTPVNDIPVESDLFQGKVFYVCGAVYDKPTRQALETSIHKHGGSFVQGYTPSVDIVLYEKETFQVKGIQAQIQRIQDQIAHPYTKSDLTKQKITDLQGILRVHHLPVSGKKDILINRILEFQKTLKPQRLESFEWWYCELNK
jgi:ATP-dependent DNA ligase I